MLFLLPRSSFGEEQNSTYVFPMEIGDYFMIVFHRAPREDLWGEMWLLAVHIGSCCSREEAEQTLCKLEVS